MKVLLSIKPEFADKIFDGTKKFEFRRTIFKNKQVKTIVVYSSSPVQKVIGEFEIETILEDQPVRLWEKTSQFAGIDKDLFLQYFSNKDLGYAIKIKGAKRYKRPFDLVKKYNITPPQSFFYIQPGEK